MNEEQAILSTLGIYKIKYSVLNDIGLSKIDAFHIDLNMIFDTLFKLKNIFNEKSSYKISIASSILNTVAHFRSYFVKNRNNTKIYLYYNRYSDNNNDIVCDINDSIDLLSVIIRYIPNLYLITNDSLDIKLSMDYFINKESTNYVYTKNPIYYQFVSKKTFILRASRDDTYIVNKNNLYNKLSGNEDKEYTISNKLLSAILSFSGVGKYKGIKGMGIKKTIKLFQKNIDNKNIINSHYANIDILFSDMQWDTDIERISYTYKDIDLIIEKNNNINNPYHIKCDSFIVDKFAKRDLKELNVKYFTGFNSIMLHELLMEPKRKTKVEW